MTRVRITIKVPESDPGPKVAEVLRAAANLAEHCPFEREAVLQLDFPDSPGNAEPAGCMHIEKD